MDPEFRLGEPRDLPALADMEVAQDTARYLTMTGIMWHEKAFEDPDQEHTVAEAKSAASPSAIPCSRGLRVRKSRIARSRSGGWSFAPCCGLVALMEVDGMAPPAASGLWRIGWAAALIYQHATSDRDRNIADRMSALLEVGKDATKDATSSSDDEDDDGAAGALAPVG
jgi:hypothetical protein